MKYLIILLILPSLLFSYEVKETEMSKQAKGDYYIVTIRKVEKFDDGRTKTTYRKETRPIKKK